MTVHDEISDEELLNRIQLDTESVAWNDLAIFFAKGKVICVDSQLALVDVAFQMSKDNRELIDELMTRRLLFVMTDELAKQWFDNHSVVLASVVSPWVLVQKIETGH